MTRQEAVAKIKEKFSFTNQQASDILQYIEDELGMIPPVNFLEKLKIYDNSWEADYENK